MSKFDFTAGIPSKLKSKIPLLPVKDIEPSKLRANPYNTTYFRTETEDYFQRLTEDIRKRGILVPLIAQKDGTILAGHNRWDIAKELKLKFVPVQFVASDLSEDETREFIIKDNLLRRQFTSGEWIDIYRKLYPNFEERLAKHGERSNGTKKRVDIVHSEKKDRKNDENVLTAERIAADTGQSKSAVQKQLQRMKKPSAVVQKNSIIARNNEDIDKKFILKIEKNLHDALAMNDITRKEIIKKLKIFIKNNS